MALIMTDRPPMLEQRTRTEIVIDQITGINDRHGLIRDYLGNERIRAYKPESAYDVFLQKKLNDLMLGLTEETAISSSSSEILSNNHFKKIIGYGEVMAPAILTSLAEAPSILVWALNQIFNMRISEKPLSIDQASASWVKWGRHNRII